MEKKCKECFDDFEGAGRLCAECRADIENAKASLSDNQKKFVLDAQDSGLEVDYFYSGRGMYGKNCPAVRVDRANDIATKAKVREDSMGLGVVIYAQY